MMETVNGWEPVLIGRPPAPAPARAPAVPPYRPDLVADGWSSEHFVVRCASVRGPAHRLRGEPRQDECAVVPHASGALVAVVADGVSAAPLSHLGATIACRTVVDYLLRALDADPSAEVDGADLLRHAGWSLVEYVARQLPPVATPAGSVAAPKAAPVAPPEAATVAVAEAATVVAATAVRGAGPGAVPDTDPQRAERALATTVVVALVRPGPPARAWLVRVGDSTAWVLRDGRWHGLFPPPPDAEVLPDGVAALPRTPATVEPVEVELAAGDVLVLGTDGFADALAGPGGTPDGAGNGAADGAAELFAGTLAEPPPMLRLAWLLDFASETYDDDRTVLAVWPTTTDP